jgi:hypothetical protein
MVNDSMEGAIAMLATLTSLFGSEHRTHLEDAALAHDWDRLLATVMSPQERDEINDVFGRATID